MFSEIINPFLNVRNKVKKQGIWVDEEEKTVRQYMQRGTNELMNAGSDEAHKVFSTYDKKVIVDELMIGLNAGMYPRFYTREDFDNNYRPFSTFGIGSSGGIGHQFMTKNRYDNFGNPFFDTYKEFESSNAEGVGIQDITFIRLKEPFISENGASMDFVQHSDYDNSYLIYYISWREIDK